MLPDLPAGNAVICIQPFAKFRSETPLNDFFHMAYPELLAVVTHLEPLHLPTGTVDKKSR